MGVWQCDGVPYGEPSTGSLACPVELSPNLMCAYLWWFFSKVAGPPITRNNPQYAAISRNQPQQAAITRNNPQ